MAKRRRYDDKFRASAVVMLEAAGYPEKEGALAEVSRHLKMPHNTLRNWYHEKHNPPPAELRQEKRQELALVLENLAYMLADAIPGKIDEANLQQTATSMAIAIDKMQLLKGQPTWRGEVITAIKEGKLNPQSVIDDLGIDEARLLLEPAGVMIIDGLAQVLDASLITS